MNEEKFNFKAIALLTALGFLMALLRSLFFVIGILYATVIFFRMEGN